jgi:hypothetical protein
VTFRRAGKVYVLLQSRPAPLSSDPAVRSNGTRESLREP